jgi:hypothetical protein
VRKGRIQAERSELSHLENILHENFTSLSEARSALRRETTSNRREISRLRKSITLARKKEQQNIQRVMRQEFPSLAQARKAIPKFLKQLEPKQVKKDILKALGRGVQEVTRKILTKTEHPSKLSQPHIDVKRRKSFTLAELRDGDKRAIDKYLKDRLNSNALDKVLLKPGEFYAAKIPYSYIGKDGKRHTGYANTYNIYQGIQSLFNRLSEYASRNKVSDRSNAKWLNTIKIVKFNGSASEYKADKIAEVNKRKKKGGKK